MVGVQGSKVQPTPAVARLFSNHGTALAKPFTLSPPSSLSRADALDATGFHGDTASHYGLRMDACVLRFKRGVALFEPKHSSLTELPNNCILGSEAGYCQVPQYALSRKTI